MQNLVPLEDRIRACIEKHPDWDDYRIRSAIRGASAGALDAVRRGVPIPPTLAPEPPQSRVDPVGKTITLGVISERYDIRQAVLRELALVPRGELLPQEELCKAASNGDRARFNRCLAVNESEFQAYRIKLRIGDAPEGKYFWGAREDVAAARKKVEEYA